MSDTVPFLPRDGAYFLLYPVGHFGAAPFTVLVRLPLTHVIVITFGGDGAREVVGAVAVLDSSLDCVGTFTTLAGAFTVGAGVFTVVAGVFTVGSGGMTAGSGGITGEPTPEIFARAGGVVEVSLVCGVVGPGKGATDPEDEATPGAGTVCPGFGSGGGVTHKFVVVLCCPSGQGAGTEVVTHTGADHVPP